MSNTAAARIVKTFREKHELSQTQLGRLMEFPGQHQQRVWQVESGRRNASLDFAKRFVRVAKNHGENVLLEDIV